MLLASAINSRPDFRHVDVWIFDLDNTLYCSESGLFAQIEQRMTFFVQNLLGLGSEEARRVQKAFYREHGTTLNGLIRVHGIDPEAYLAFVHDIDLSSLEQNPKLASALECLPGRKYVFTNGCRNHATRVLNRLALAHLFDELWDIRTIGYRPKPDPDSYRAVLARASMEPGEARCSTIFPAISFPRTNSAAPPFGSGTIPSGRGRGRSILQTGVAMSIMKRMISAAFSKMSGREMSEHLPRVIDEAWKARETLGVSTRGEIRDAVGEALDGLDTGRLRVAEKHAGEWHVHQWLKKAVLLSFRLNDMKLIAGAPGGAQWWDKVEFQISRLGRGDVSRSGFSRRAGRDRAPLGVHRQRRGADAVLRECRRPCRRKHDDRHLGDRRFLRAGRPQLPHLGRRGHGRRARAAAGRPRHHRGQLLHRRALGSGGRRDRG